MAAAESGRLEDVADNFNWLGTWRTDRLAAHRGVSADSGEAGRQCARLLLGQGALGIIGRRNVAGNSQGLEPYVSVKDVDSKLDIELVQSPERSFWIPRGESQRWGGKHLLAFLLAEHPGWAGRTHRTPLGPVTRPRLRGSCRRVHAHGLAEGAAKVVAVEPDPLNLECLRRNFAQEIAVRQSRGRPERSMEQFNGTGPVRVKAEFGKQ